jgi:hypothetical protein
MIVGPASKVAILLEHIGAPAGGIQFLDDRHLVAAHGEADRGGETAESAADDHRVRAGIDVRAR